jgi:hypothetical protein
MKLCYGVSLSDLEITDVPGYWKDKEPKNHRGHPLHGCIGCGDPFRATYVFFDPHRDHLGRWSSKTRTWAVLRQASRKKIENIF